MSSVALAAVIMVAAPLGFAGLGLESRFRERADGFGATISGLDDRAE